MKKNKFKKNIPIISIQKFRADQVAGRDEIIFNEIIGERIIEKLHAHDFFIIILFIHAKGTHDINNQSYSIGDNEVHILFPGQMHKWHLKEGTKAYQLMIERQFFEQFSSFFRFSFTNYQNNPIIKLNKDSYSKLKYEFISIKKELKKQKASIHLISARAAVIAAIVSEQAEDIFDEFKVYQTNERLAQYNLLIDLFFTQNKTVGFYAKKLNISANYLNILCKKDLKVSAIQQRVIVEAKKLITNNKSTLKEITFELGFTDTAYFSNYFKKHTGMSPSQFRSLQKKHQ